MNLLNFIGFGHTNKKSIVDIIKIEKNMTFNIVAACFMAFMCSMTVFSPKDFMEGGVSKIPWFKNIPEDPRHRVYYTSVFLAIVCLCGGVVPTVLSPTSGLLCLQYTILFFANLLHVIIFLGSNTYDKIRPNANTSSYFQWVFMTVITVAFGIWGIFTYEKNTDWLSTVTFNGPISIQTANIVGIVFSSGFGFQFLLMPQHLLSAFWADDKNVEGKHFIGFPVIDTYQGEIFWARNTGITILGLNIGGLAYGLSNPLLTIQLLLITTVLTLFNINQLIMEPYGKKSNRNIFMSWVPTLLMCGGDIAISALALQT